MQDFRDEESFNVRTMLSSASSKESVSSGTYALNTNSPVPAAVQWFADIGVSPLMSGLVASYSDPLEVGVLIRVRLAVVSSSAWRGKDAHGQQGGQEGATQRQCDSGGLGQFRIHGLHSFMSGRRPAEQRLSIVLNQRLKYQDSYAFSSRLVCWVHCTVTRAIVTRMLRLGSTCRSRVGLDLWRSASRNLAAEIPVHCCRTRRNPQARHGTQIRGIRAFRLSSS